MKVSYESGRVGLSPWTQDRRVDVSHLSIESLTGRTSWESDPNPRVSNRVLISPKVSHGCRKKFSFYGSRLRRR